MQRRRSVTRLLSARDPVASASERVPRETGWWSSELYKSQSSRLVNSVGYSFPTRWLPVALSLPLPWILKLPALRLLFPVRLVCQRASRQLRCALSGKQAASSAVTPPPNFRLAMGHHGDAATKDSSWVCCLYDSDGQVDRAQAGGAGRCLSDLPTSSSSSSSSVLCGVLAG